jgi:hypothetical protein
VAQHGHRHRLVGIGHDLRAFLQHVLRVFGQEADELLAARRGHVGPGERALADEIGLLVPTAQAMPASSGVSVPSVSCPTMT